LPSLTIDVVWDAESGRSKENIAWGVDAPKGRGTFGGVRPIEKHCKA